MYTTMTHRSFSISTASLGRASPKYLMVKELLSEKIRSGELKVGDQIPSLRQLVETSNVSASTCQKAINSLIDDGVLRGEQGRGVFVRSTFGRSDVRQVAMIAWSDPAVASHPAFNATINGLMAPLAQAGCQLNISFLDPARLHVEEMQARIAQIHAAGIVINYTPHAIQDALLPLTHKQVPIVALGRRMDQLTPYAVFNNVRDALGRVVREALKESLWPIALVGSPVDDICAQRIEVLREEIEGTPYAFEQLIIRRGPATHATGYQFMHELLKSSPRPRLVLADDEYVAYGALAALREAGVRVPEQMQLLGIGGFLNRSPSLVELSTLCVPFAGMGEAAGRMILRLVKGQPLEQSTPVMLDTLIDTCQTFVVPNWRETALFNEQSVEAVAQAQPCSPTQ